MKLWMLLGALLCTALLAVLHLFSLSTYLYWRYVWLDVPVHFLGGFAMGLFMAGVLPSFKPKSFMLLVAGILLGWELFEVLAGTPRENNYYFDTSLDLLMGALGASLAYLIARRTLWRSA